MVDGVARYTVELCPPAGGWAELQQATARARRSARELTAEGTPVRLLRSVFVPEDDTCFLLFEAGSPDVVRAAVLRAELTPR